MHEYFLCVSLYYPLPSVSIPIECPYYTAMTDVSYGILEHTGTRENLALQYHICPTTPLAQALISGSILYSQSPD